MHRLRREPLQRVAQPPPLGPRGFHSNAHPRNVGVIEVVDLEQLFFGVVTLSEPESHEEEFFHDIDDGEDGNSSLHRPARAGGALASTSLAPNFTFFPGFWPGPAGAPGGPGAAGESFGISPEPMHGASGSTVAAESDACFSRVRFSNASLLGEDGHDDSLTSPAAAARQPSANAAVSSFELTFLHANIRSFGFKSKTKSAEIKRLIERSDFPTFVFFTETWLDKSSEELSLEGYVEVSRKDRQSSAHGGVAAFARAGFENTIVHIGDSKVAERSWHVIHSNRGPLLVGLWYRRPDKGEVLSIESLESELDAFGSDVLGTILLGDMNVHEQSWLSFSDGSSIEGRALRDLACSHGLEERVRTPTRGPYLRDIVLTDLGSEVKARPVPGVSDHSAVLGSL